MTTGQECLGETGETQTVSLEETAGIFIDKDEVKQILAKVLNDIKVGGFRTVTEGRLEDRFVIIGKGEDLFDCYVRCMMTRGRNQPYYRLKIEDYGYRQGWTKRVILIVDGASHPEENGFFCFSEYPRVLDETGRPKREDLTMEEKRRFFRQILNSSINADVTLCKVNGYRKKAKYIKFTSISDLTPGA